MDNKRGFRQSVLFLIVAAILSFQAHAQSFLGELGSIGVSLLAVYNSSRTLDFVITWFLINGTIWFVFNKFEERSSMHQKDGNKNLKKTGWIIIATIAIFGTGSIADAVVNNPDIVSNVWTLSWIIFIYFSTFFTTTTEKGEKHDYGSYAFLYFVSSVIVAPFNSLLSTKRIAFGDWMIHGAIAFIVMYWWPVKREKAAEQKKALEETEKLEKEEAKRMLELRGQRAFELKKMRLEHKLLRNKMEDKDEVVQKLLQQATSGASNFATMNPFLISLAEAVPTEDRPLIPLAPKINAQQKVDELRNMLLNRRRIIDEFTKKYTETNPGKEAAYLLQIVNDLVRDRSLKERQKWVAYLGKNWDEALFAEKLKEFGNKENELWIKVFRKAAKKGIDELIGAIKRRVVELAKERKLALNEYTVNVELIAKLTPDLSAQYKKNEEEVNLLNDKIIARNNKVSEFNNLVNVTRNSLVAAAKPDTSDTDRRNLVITRIAPLFTRALDALKQIGELELQISEMNEEYKGLINGLRKVEENMFAIRGMTALINQRYGLQLLEATT